MDRRELLKLIAAITGTALVGGEFFLAGCKSKDQPGPGQFSTNDIAFFDEVAETIIPKTDTPGAKDAAVGRFMAMYSTDCYTDEQIKALKNGILQIDAASEKKYSKTFLELTPERREEILTEIDEAAKAYNEKDKDQPVTDAPPHYFTLMKQLVLLGFFTSEPGVTHVLRYVPVPGKYEGCIDYKGETAWA